MVLLKSIFLPLFVPSNFFQLPFLVLMMKLENQPEIRKENIDKHSHITQ